MSTTARALVRGRIVLTLLVMGAATTLLAPPPAHAASIRVPRSFFGLHDGSMLAYDHLTYGALRIWDAGATWQQIEPSPGSYDWTRLDALVSAAQAHHVKVTLVLGMTPSFYADSPSQPPAHLGSFTAYVRAVMARYRYFDGRRGIESYQVWNEGNVSRFWTGTPQQLARLTAVVARSRNAVDPGATVVAPSFASRLISQQRWIGRYQRQCVDGRPVWHFYDVNALSLYPRATYDGRPGGPEDAIRLLHQVRHRFARIGVPATKPVWATELNYGLGSGEPAQGSAEPISDGHQVANVLRTYLLGAARRLGRVYWYRYDWGRTADGGTIGNTLLSDPDDPSVLTPAGRALRIAEHWLDGRLVTERGRHRPCARDRWGTYTCLVRHGDRTRTILWNPHRRVRVQVRTADGSRTSVVRVGYRPVMVDTR
ncbi:MAG TPA: hypothetical protein VGK78_03925 [Nocardioides sp.]|uniref:hypothetical protein n=1 Tax=Nocardioides sp. TaxID=35761 RepID=UPI002F41A057